MFNFINKQFGYGAIVGAIIIAIIGAWLHFKYPNEIKIKIKDETPTTTTIKVVPPDYQKCLDCINSKGEIHESISNNVMNIFYENSCIKAEKQVTLEAFGQRKHFLMFQLTDTVDTKSYRQYGADISYFYMLFNNIGLGGGLGINTQPAVNFHAGLLVNW
jgi:hypothetical protein